MTDEEMRIINEMIDNAVTKLSAKPKPTQEPEKTLTEKIDDGLKQMCSEYELTEVKN